MANPSPTKFQSKRALQRLSQPPDRVFVYGTLKSAEPNSRLMKWADGELIGKAVTFGHFPLIIDRGLPFLLPFPGNGANVHGELFTVPKWGILEILDALEGHPQWYVRTRVNVSCEGKPYRAWTYMLNETCVPRDWRRMPMLSSYSVYGKPPPLSETTK